MVTPARAGDQGRAGPAAPERAGVGADGEHDEDLGGERLDEPAGLELRWAGVQTCSRIAKMRKSNSELSGPKVSMKRRISRRSQCAGRASWSGRPRVDAVGGDGDLGRVVDQVVEQDL